MTGHLYFGNNIYVLLLSIRDNLGDILFCEKSSRSLRGSLLGIVLTRRTPLGPLLSLPPCGVSGKTRVRRNLHSPAGIIGKVKMKGIHLQHIEDIYLAENEILVAEVTAYVEHDAPMGEPGIIDNRAE